MNRLIPSALFSVKHAQLVELRQSEFACALIWERATDHFRNDPQNEQKVRELLRLLGDTSTPEKGP